MSIYDAIANAGSNAGAGLNAFAQGRYQVQQDQRRNAMADRAMSYQDEDRKLAMQDRYFSEAANMIAGGASEDQAISYLNQASQQHGWEPVRDPAAVVAGLRGRLDSGKQAQYGTSLAYATDEAGNTYAYQVSNQGGASEVALPPGRMFTRPMSIQNLGDVVAGVNDLTGATTVLAPRGLPPQDTPEIKGAQEAAKQDAITGAIPRRTIAEIQATFEKKAAEYKQQGQFDLPQAAANAESALSVIDGLVSNPGLDYIVGAASLLPIVPDTPQADAYAYLEQLQGKAFLEAFATLKGGGQITEIEGAKATAAIARLNRAQSKEAFLKSLDELRQIANKGLERARAKASDNAPKVDVQGVVPAPDAGETYEQKRQRLLGR